MARIIHENFNWIKIDFDRLENAKGQGDKVTARCPACKEAGGDSEGNHFVGWRSTGKYGCIKFPGAAGAWHRRRILELVGEDAPKEIVFKETKQPKGWRTLNEAIEAVRKKIEGVVAVRRYEYSGTFTVVRFETAAGKEIRPFSMEGSRWFVKEPKAAPLYNLCHIERSSDNEIVVWHEGEKCCDHFSGLLGYISTTANRGSANDLSKVDMRVLAGRKVVVIADNDEPGRKHVRKVAAKLRELTPPANVTVIEHLPGCDGKGDDAFDWIQLGNDAGKTKEQMREEFEALIIQAESPPCIEGDGEAEDVTSPTSPNSPPLPAREAVYPKDSVLENFMAFAREYSESEDAILVGALLPVVAGLLGRRVFVQFGEKKYPNLYTLLVTKPGLRKSTSIRIVERLAKRLLPQSSFIQGAASEQAIFKQYLPHPDKLMIEEEGNTVLSNWANDAAGKIVAKRFLRLYDCASWSQSYIRQEEAGGNTTERIDETSTSLVIGTTFNNCRFNGLEVMDGMRRRVAYYLSEKLARTIYFPAALDGEEFNRVASAFSPLVTLNGEMKLSAQARKVWIELQDRNREEIQAVQGMDKAAEAYGCALAEEGSRTLKFAMLFEACRWALDSTRDAGQIQADTLQMAAAHGRYCIESGRELDSIGRRGETRDEADSILASIREEMAHTANNGRIQMTRTQLTHRFAAHAGRRNAMTPTRLYDEIIPDIIKRGFANLQGDGRPQVYSFLLE